MDVLSWILAIFAIITAILSGELDRAVKGGGTVKKVLLVFSLAVLCIVLLPHLFAMFY